jgi:hypothetical protein
VAGIIHRSAPSCVCVRYAASQRCH